MKKVLGSRRGLCNSDGPENEKVSGDSGGEFTKPAVYVTSQSREAGQLSYCISEKMIDLRP
jgi:hypothetical protein